MAQLRYIEDAVTLAYDESLCNGCGLCVAVCPRAVFAMQGRYAALVDRGACLECGACALNCVTGAISVEAGVGCAQAIITGWLTGSEPTCDCG
jgi:ferredoxin